MPLKTRSHKLSGIFIKGSYERGLAKKLRHELKQIWGASCGRKTRHTQRSWKKGTAPENMGLVCLEERVSDFWLWQNGRGASCRKGAHSSSHLLGFHPWLIGLFLWASEKAGVHWWAKLPISMLGSKERLLKRPKDAQSPLVHTFSDEKALLGPCS